jgi:hypothetical protein
MFDIFYIPPVIQFISNLLVVIILVVRFKIIKKNLSKYQIGKLSIINLIIFCCSLYTTYRYNSSYPPYHVGLPLIYLVSLEILQTKVLFKKLYKVALFLAILIFTYETVILNGFLRNNELFTEYFNFSLSIFAALSIFKNSKINSNYFASVEFFLSSIIFISSSSRLILSLMETEFRNGDELGLFFMILIYNSIDFIQNMSFSYILLKWKEI